uniref:RNA methyltransferase At5g10620 n=1 Tax=Nelumbo nucifera TaxID=4432 RepID=A0A822ZSX4_NELNU|nr:TPA_asm: hypothetical protein HUJ06_004246 [Nelumbo nucifera]
MIISIQSGHFCAKERTPSPGRRSKYSGQSVRPLPVRILTVGKRRSPGVQLLVEEYKEKLKHYCSVEDVQIRSNPKNTSHLVYQHLTDGFIPFNMYHLISCFSDKFSSCILIQCSNVKAQIEGEDMVAMQNIRSEDWVILLDEHGSDIGSEQMADLVGDAGNTGSSTIAFCIGGPYGHGQQLRHRANVTIKLSSLVLNHQIALLVLLEQLYRAWTIIKGQKYHH